MNRHHYFKNYINDHIMCTYYLNNKVHMMWSKCTWCDQSAHDVIKVHMMWSKIFVHIWETNKQRNRFILDWMEIGLKEQWEIYFIWWVKSWTLNINLFLQLMVSMEIKWVWELYCLMMVWSFSWLYIRIRLFRHVTII